MCRVRGSTLGPCDSLVVDILSCDSLTVDSPVGSETGTTSSLEQINFRRWRLSSWCLLSFEIDNLEVEGTDLLGSNP